MKLIIEIPEEIYSMVMNTGTFGKYRFNTSKAIKKATPLDDVKAEIKKKCDCIDDIAGANMYQYVPHREIQDLLCEILASIDNAESEGE